MNRIVPIMLVITSIALIMVSIALLGTRGKERSCESYRNVTMKNIPARCASYFEQGRGE